ncbi:hypothetical protein MRX96_002796 [Rhipicephalus microplus]
MLRGRGRPPGGWAMKAHVPGDIVLGGLFPIHEKGERTRCGKINKDRGIQRLEAMLFAIDRINEDPSLLGGIRLGATILDTCSSDTYALNQSLEFIRASLNTVDTNAFQCSDGAPPKLRFSSRAISGVVGGSYSEVSLQVANLLRLFRIPPNQPRFDGHFAKRQDPLRLLRAHQGQYGDSGMTAFTREARARNICIAVNEKVPHSATMETFDQIYQNLLLKANARGVVLFTRAEDARGVLAAAKRANRSEDFVWVASDGWGKQEKLVEGLEEVAEGAITIELESRFIPEFDAYMRNLTVENNRRNPWFKEYWEDVFQCVVRNDDGAGRAAATATRRSGNGSSLPTCSKNLRLDESVGYLQESKVQFVLDAVYAMAHALHKVWEHLCEPRNELYCSAMRDVDGGVLYKKYLLNVTFEDMAGSIVRFDLKGDGLAPYRIYNYQRQQPNTSRYEYRAVGRWLDELQLNVDEVRWAHNSRRVPVSICSAQCGVGEIKIVQAGDTCCWICNRCEPWQYVLDEYTCADCGDGRWPYAHKLSCYNLTLQYMRFDSIFAVVPVVIACLGIVLTLATMAVFVANNETPIVKASGRELSYLLLSGILICYLMTALLTKTNRISRIFESARRSARRPSFISPKSQVVISLMLISVQVVASVVWFVVEPPSVRREHPDGKRDQVILKCRIKDSSFLVSLVYNMMLICVCTVYAIKTRKIPENFNESKFIGFTMYTTCIIWLAFVPIYFGTGNSFQIQITTLCVSISLSAYVALFCLFSPKIYIILCHPDKNVRKLTMNSATYKKAPTSSTCGTSVNHGTGECADPSCSSTVNTLCYTRPLFKNAIAES